MAIMKTQLVMSKAPMMDVMSTGSANMTTSQIKDSTILKLRVTDIGPALSYLKAVVWKYWLRIPATPMANSIHQV